MSKKFNSIKTNAWKAELKKTWYWGVYFDWMSNIAASSIKWEGVPHEIDLEFVERKFLTHNSLLFFRDVEYMFLPYTFDSGIRTVYDKPNSYVVNRPNGYYNDSLDIFNAVPVFCNIMMIPEIDVIENFVARLVDVLITLEVLLDKVRIPDLITGPKEMQLQIENAYQQRKMGVPAIIGTELLNEITFTNFGVKDNQYIGDKLQIQMEKIWNEFLTWCGVPNVSQAKKERMVSDEVNRALGGVIASRNSRLVSRNEGADKINRMFGLNVRALFRDGDEFSDGLADWEERDTFEFSELPADNGGIKTDEEGSQDV